MESLFTELKRRNIFRVGIAYLVLGWVERKLSAATPPKQADVKHLVEFVIAGLRRGS